MVLILCCDKTLPGGGCYVYLIIYYKAHAVDIFEVFKQFYLMQVNVCKDVEKTGKDKNMYYITNTVHQHWACTYGVQVENW